MSSSSENSLTELPSPFDISSAVSRALRVHSSSAEELQQQSSNNNNNNNSNGRAGRSVRSLSYPISYYDYPSHHLFLHQANTSGPYGSNVMVDSQSEQNYAASYFYPAASCGGNPYFYSSRPADSAGPPATADPLGAPPPLGADHFQAAAYYYGHYTPAAASPMQVQMEVETWTENSICDSSICNSSSEMLESQSNLEQLDRFCKYIDSSGDEELVMAEDNARALGRGRGAVIGSPPKKKRRGCSVGVVRYYDEEEEEEEEEEGEGRSWKVELENSDMWKEFDRVGTEMVITKAGRYGFL